MNKIFRAPLSGRALVAGFLIPALMAAGLCGCPTESRDPGDTDAPGLVRGVYGYYNKMAGGVTLTWADPADEDLAEIRIGWNGGSATVAKGAGTYTVAAAEDRIAPSYEITLQAADAAGNEAEVVTVRVRPDITRSMIPVPGGTVTILPPGTMHSGVFVNTPATVEPFYILATEVSYDLWYEVRTWALGKGYIFINEGREGHDGLDGAAPTASRWEPAMSLSMRDAIVWCNAWSEKTGKNPAYYEDEACTVILRESQDFPPKGGEGKAETAHIKPGADGYRLPSREEWTFAARGGVPCDDPDDTDDPWNYPYAGSNTPGEVAWYAANAGGRTHNVAEKQPNSLGIYDMSGNVRELNSYNPRSPSDTYGDTYQPYGGCYGDSDSSLKIYNSPWNVFAFEKNNWIGFRPVAARGL
jgi:formylglycine-generating enzyme required for sulfatase activity